MLAKRYASALLVISLLLSSIGRLTAQTPQSSPSVEPSASPAPSAASTPMPSSTNLGITIQGDEDVFAPPDSINLPQPSSMVYSPVPNLFTGKASVKIPLDLPPARNGLSPKLALQYQNVGTNGWLGVGWDFPLDTIERSAKFGVDLNGNDYVLNLNGSQIELLKIGENQFRSKIENSFLQIKMVISTDNQKSWVVTEPDGTRYSFGRTPSSRQDNAEDQTQIFRWCLDRIEDTHGNFISLSYAKPVNENQIYLDRIEYAGNGQLAPSNYVTFKLEPRADTSDVFTTNFRVRTASRLKSIEAFANDSLMTRYDLSYDTDQAVEGQQYSPTTGRSLLTAVTKYGRDGSTSQTLMSMLYPNYAGAFVSPMWEKGAAPNIPVGNECFSGDFNGDGKTDFTCYSGSSSGWNTALSFGTGWNTAMWASGPSPGLPVRDRCLTGDFNGDAKTDLTCYTGANRDWHTVISTGTGWQKINGAGGPHSAIPITAQCSAGDFNGDGKTDLSCYTGANGIYQVALSTGTGWSSADWAGGPGPGQLIDKCLLGDFTGDGKTDVSCYTGAGGNWQTAISTGSGWQSPTWGGGPAPGIPISKQCIPGDFNGDSKTDVTCYLGNGSWQTVVSKGWGWQSIDSAGLPAPSIPIGNQCRSGDFNGDTRTDIVCYSGTGGTYNVALSTGAGWRSVPGGSAPVANLPTGNQCIGGDFDGDGKSDFSCYSGAVGRWNMALSAGSFPDLLSAFKNALGGVTKLTYKSSTNYRNAQLNFPIQTIAAIEEGDGRENPILTSFDFEGGFYQSVEREFRGFNSVKVMTSGAESGENSTTQIWFHQGNETLSTASNPGVCVGFMKGKPYRAQIRDQYNNVHFETQISYVSNPSFNCDLAASVPLFNPPQMIDVFTCNGDSCAKGKHLRTVFGYDTFGNVIREERFGDMQDPSDDYTLTRSYSPNLSRWIINLPANETIYAGIHSPTKLAATDYYYDGVVDCLGGSTNQTPIKGDLTAIVWWNSEGHHPEAHFAYDRYGNVFCSKDPKGNTTKISYDSSFTFPTSINDPENLRSQFEYYGVDGQGTEQGTFGSLKTFTDPNGLSTTIEYDKLAREQKVIHADGSATEVSYNQWGNANEQSISVDYGLGTIVSTYLDGLGRWWKKRMTGPSETSLAIQRTYNKRGLIRAISLPYFETIDSPVWERYQYDIVGRLIELANPDQTTRQVCYKDWVTTLIDENGHLSRITEDAFGRAIQVQEYEGNYQQCIADATIPMSETDKQTLSRLLPDYSPPGVVPPYSTNNYQYDFLGRLISVKDAKNNEVAFRYNSLGQRKEMRDPDLGRWTYDYDLNGNLVTQVDAEGRKTYYQYDSINRLQQEDYKSKKPLGSGDLVFTYDIGGGYGKGELTAMKDATGREDYYYDKLNRMVSSNKYIGSKKYSVEVSYDIFDRLTSVTYPNNHKVNYDYDGPFLSKISDPKTVYARYSNFNSLGQPGTVTFGNGLVTTYSYSGFNNPECLADNFELCAVAIYAGNGQLYSRLHHSYDAIGNLTGLTDESYNHRSFVYDAEDRLVATGYGDNHSGTAQMLMRLPPTTGLTLERFKELLKNWQTDVSWSSTYVYDEIGNITYNPSIGSYQYLSTGTGGTSHPHSPSTVGTSSVAYDRTGNITQVLNRTYTYDEKNRLTTAQRNGLTTTFVYDGNGQRIKKTTSGKSTTYLGDLYQCNPDNKCTEFIYKDDELVAQISGNGPPFYYSLDHVGSTTLITDSTGAVIQKFVYGPYGEISINENLALFSRTFTGQEYDVTTGLYYYNSRYYDPQLGRFVSPDSEGGFLLNLQSFNRYSYVLNNPLNFVDPTGNTPGDRKTDPDLAKGKPGDARGPFEKTTEKTGGREQPNREVKDSGRSGSEHTGADKAGPGDRTPQRNIPPEQRIRPNSTGLAEPMGHPGELLIAVVAFAVFRATMAVSPLILAVVVRARKFDWSRAQHIFRDAPGHVNPRRASQGRFARLFERVANNPSNKPTILEGRAGAAGINQYSQKFRNGKSVWVQTRGNKITNAGVNPP